MPDKVWKKMERKVAKQLKGQRIPCSGISGGRLSGDVLHDKYYVECKYRKHWNVWSIFREVEKEAKKLNKVPLLVIKERDKKGELVIKRLDTEKEIHDIVLNSNSRYGIVVLKERDKNTGYLIRLSNLEHATFLFKSKETLNFDKEKDGFLEISNGAKIETKILKEAYSVIKTLGYDTNDEIWVCEKANQPVMIVFKNETHKYGLIITPSMR